MDTRNIGRRIDRDDREELILSPREHQILENVDANAFILDELEAMIAAKRRCPRPKTPPNGCPRGSGTSTWPREPDLKAQKRAGT